MTKLSVECEVLGRYRIDAIRFDANGIEVSRRELAPWFWNLITDQGLERLGTAGTNQVWNICQVGTSNTPPSFTDTWIGNKVAHSPTIITTTKGINQDDGYTWRRNTWQFNEGVATGILAELTTGWSTATTGIFSHALILDGFGNPTTIEVLSDETLQVTWEVRFYYPQADNSGTIEFTGNIGGIYNYTCRTRSVGAGGNNWSLQEGGGGMGITSEYIHGGSALGPITGSLTYSSRSAAPVAVALPYVPGSYESKARVTIPLASGNYPSGLNGITFDTIRNGCAFQMVIDPPIPKTNTQVVTLTLAVKWGRK